MDPRELAFEFVPVAVGERRMLYPLVEVRLRAPSGEESMFLGLVDSGADHCLLPTRAAEALGIDVADLPAERIGGVGGPSMVAWTEVEIRLTDGRVLYTDRFRAQVLTGSQERGFPVLLGREPLFHLFDVTFQHHHLPGSARVVLRENPRCPADRLGHATIERVSDGET